MANTVVTVTSFLPRGISSCTAGRRWDSETCTCSIRAGWGEGSRWSPLTCSSEQVRSSSWILSRVELCRRQCPSRPRGSEASRMLRSCSRGSEGCRGDWRTSGRSPPPLLCCPGSSSDNVETETEWLIESHLWVSPAPVDDVVDMIRECSLQSLRAFWPAYPVGVTVVAPHTTRERENIKEICRLACLLIKLWAEGPQTYFSSLCVNTELQVRGSTLTTTTTNIEIYHLSSHSIVRGIS